MAAGGGAGSAGRRVVLLRAVNLGSVNKVPMARLRELAADLGATEISTFIASGNLLCVPPGDPADLDRALERAIADELGVTTDAISRSPAELRAALDAHPFEVLQPKLSHVWFLAGDPDPAGLETLRARDRGETEWQAIGRELHLRYPDGGVHTTSISTAALARLLGVTGTGRNLQTVGRLVELAEQ